MRTTFKKGSFILVLVLLTAITFFTLKSESQATLTYYFTVTVVQAGPNSGLGCFHLTGGSPAITDAWYYSRPDQIGSSLATALTAISLGKTVVVSIDSGSPTVIQGIFVAQ